jgi:hypothetical protein
MPLGARRRLIAHYRRSTAGVLPPRRDGFARVRLGAHYAVVTDADPPPDRHREHPVSERDRTLTHLAILAVIVVLIGAGVWMANAILEVRRIQDCAMAGRRNCERITTPGRESWDLPAVTR